MSLRIIVDAENKNVVLQECAKLGIEPEVVREAKGFDGAAAAHFLFTFGPPVIQLVTALVAVWKETMRKEAKPRPKGRGRKVTLQILVDAGDDD